MFGRNLSFLESEEHRLLRETVQKFVQDRIAPVAEEIDASDRFPEELFREMADLGLLGLMVSEQYGGFGHDALAAVIVLEEISRQSPAVGLSLLAHAILCAHNLDRWGTPELKERYLPDLVSGKRLGGMAITEPNAGSDVYSITTQAVDQGDFFVLNGSKIFITNAAVADVLVVYALTDQGHPRESMSTFVVETHWEGVSVTKSFEKMGMRGSPTGVVYFDQVKIPKENLLGTRNRGFYQLMKSFEIERITISAQGLGIALQSLEWILHHALERKQFGKQLADFEMIQDKIAQIAAQIDSLRTYLYLVAREYDPEADLRFEAATAKLLISKLAVESALEAIQVLGGYGYTREYPVERLMRDAKLLEIGAGTSEIMKLILARDLIGKIGTQRIC